MRFVRFVDDPGYVTAHGVPVTLCDSPGVRSVVVRLDVPTVSCYRVLKHVAAGSPLSA